MCVCVCCCWPVELSSPAERVSQKARENLKNYIRTQIKLNCVNGHNKSIFIIYYTHHREQCNTRRLLSKGRLVLSVCVNIYRISQKRMGGARNLGADERWSRMKTTPKNKKKKKKNGENKEQPAAQPKSTQKGSCVCVCVSVMQRPVICGRERERERGRPGNPHLEFPISKN